MSVVQGLNHMAAIISAKTMKDSGVGLSETLDYGTPVYKIRTALLARLISESPALYADIGIANPNIKKIINTLKKNTDELCAILEAGDKDLFMQYFSSAFDYFSEYREAGVEQSNKLIQLISRS